MVQFSMTLNDYNPPIKVTEMPCAQLTRDVFCDS